MAQLVAIVGRPNVGKSTLFNRLTETRQAIVDPTAGTTRDRQYGKVDWCGREFSIVDTGGWVVNSDDIFEEEINKQVAVAIEQADEILFVVDAMNGVTDLDDHVAEILRKSRKPVLLVANKVDSNEWLYNVPEFYSLGLGDPYPVSAVSGYGTGDLLDEIVKKLPAQTVPRWPWPPQSLPLAADGCYPARFPPQRRAPEGQCRSGTSPLGPFPAWCPAAAYPAPQCQPPFPWSISATAVKSPRSCAPGGRCF